MNGLSVVTDRTRLDRCVCGRPVRAVLLTLYVRAGIVRQLLTARVWRQLDDGHPCPARALRGIKPHQTLIDEHLGAP